MLIYTTTSSQRLTYILDLVFNGILGIDYKLTHNADEFSFFTGAKINYSEAPIGSELFIFATKLLFQKGIKNQEISVFDWADTKAFFATHPRYALPFDPFAAIFYMVTRYEEYLPHKGDLHQRFDAQESLAFRKGFLHQPVVDLYAAKLRALVQEYYPGTVFPKRSYTYISTIDIDNAWAYKEKGIIRNGGALFRSLFRFEFSKVFERLAVLVEKKKDPYDTYDLLNEIQQEFGLSCIYFFLLGDYGVNDKNVSVTRRNFQALIKSIADYNEVGIHPSYASNTHPNRLRMELYRLQKVVRRDISRSRQHFLKLEFPGTYRNLIECDITDDYTMGFASEPGFRAGTCTPYFFYDLDREAATTLRVHPFMAMDATFRYYKKIRPEEVLGYVQPLIRAVKSVDGTFISLWHNESISNHPPWDGWRQVYREVAKAAAS